LQLTLLSWILERIRWRIEVYLSRHGPSLPADDFLSLSYYFDEVYRKNRPKLSFSARDEDDWKEWQRESKDKLISLLGVLVSKRGMENYEVRETYEEDDITVRHLYIWGEEHTKIPALFLIPPGNEHPKPAVICLHGHNPGKICTVGKKKSDSGSNYGIALAKRGLITISLDQWGFGERGIDEPRLSLNALLFGKTLLGLRILDVMIVTDFLQRQPEVDSKRIACIGQSLGGTVAAFTAALDERIKATVISGYLNTFKRSILEEKHCPCNYVPGILEYFELYDIVSLIAPRPLFIIHGKNDPSFPFDGAKEAFHKINEVYRFLKSEDKIGCHFFEGGHKFVGSYAYPWLEKHIRS
jgi:fermentation-respiration switch protein FrsA (DUF1100 family)